MLNFQFGKLGPWDTPAKGSVPDLKILAHRTWKVLGRLQWQCWELCELSNSASFLALVCIWLAGGGCDESETFPFVYCWEKSCKGTDVSARLSYGTTMPIAPSFLIWKPLPRLCAVTMTPVGRCPEFSGGKHHPPNISWCPKQEIQTQCEGHVALQGVWNKGIPPFFSDVCCNLSAASNLQ